MFGLGASANVSCATRALSRPANSFQTFFMKVFALLGVRTARTKLICAGAETRAAPGAGALVLASVPRQGYVKVTVGEWRRVSTELVIRAKQGGGGSGRLKGMRSRSRRSPARVPDSKDKANAMNKTTFACLFSTLCLVGLFVTSCGTP